MRVMMSVLGCSSEDMMNRRVCGGGETGEDD